VKTKLQAIEDTHDDEDNNTDMIHFSKKLYKRHGISLFARGWQVSALQSALEKSLYFLAYTAMKEAHKTLTGRTKLDGMTNMVLGYLSEWAHLPLSLPIDAWTKRIQTAKHDGEAPMRILLFMLSDRSTRFYKGISAYLLLGFKPAIQHTIYEQCRHFLVAGRKDKTLSAVEAFFLGMFSRSIATTVVFPFIRAKVLLQTEEKATGMNERNGSSLLSSTSQVVTVIQQQYQKRGMDGLFQGLGPEVTRGALSAAVMLVVKERIASLVLGKLAERKRTNYR
jgi:hypothetical protein